MRFIKNPEKPVITTMIKSKTTDTILAEIGRALEAGTDAFGWQVEGLPAEMKKPDLFKKMFDAMGDKPCYVTNYRRSNSEKLSDERIAEQMIQLAECGAVLIDVHGDIFCETKYELTYDSRAVERQMALIRELHRRGAEVLMSSHVLEFRSLEETLAISRAHYERGADISKIVTEANSEAELNENFDITFALKREIPIPTLFLCNGSHCRRHRLFGPTLGSCMYLCVEDNTPDKSSQPKLSIAKQIVGMY